MPEQDLKQRTFDRLSELLKAGCLITMPDGCAAVLADAAELSDDRLWFFEAFGESNQNEHTIEYDRAEDDGYWVTLYSGNEIVASLGPIEEDSEAVALWKAWQKHLTTDDGRYAAQAIADMKRAAIDWNE